MSEKDTEITDFEKEKAADCFAYNLLMPEKEVKKVLKELGEINLFRILFIMSQHFGLTRNRVLARLEQLDLIDWHNIDINRR